MFIKSSKKLYIILVTLFLLSCSDEGVNPVYGCLDPESPYYCEECNIDDGSCNYNEDLLGECDGDVTDCAGECGGSAVEDECGVCDENYTYRFSDIVDLFELNNCLECHSATINGSPFEDLDLSSYEIYHNYYNFIRGVLEVIEDCTDTENSLLLKKIDEGSMSIYASPELIDAVRIWISEGAPE